MNGFIVVDPKICSGKPVIKGTRIMVKNILGMVAGGCGMDRILRCISRIDNGNGPGGIGICCGRYRRGASYRTCLKKF